MINRIYTTTSVDPPANQHETGQPSLLPEPSMEKVRSSIESAGRMIGENPVAALGAALVVGVALGWMVKRW